MTTAAEVLKFILTQGSTRKETKGDRIWKVIELGKNGLAAKHHPMGASFAAMRQCLNGKIAPYSAVPTRDVSTDVSGRIIAPASFYVA